MKPYDRLVRDTAAYRQTLYSVPQLFDALQGRISRETYLAYLAEAWHHVRHTVPLLMATGARLPDDKAWLRKAIAAYIDEEIGHEEWILGDIKAAGGDPERVRQSKPRRETALMIAYNYDQIARRNPVGFFGMVYMLESTSTEIAQQGATALRSSLDLPPEAFTYLTSHGALDIEHLAFFRDTVNALSDPDDVDAIIDVAQNAFLLFAAMLRSIPHGTPSAVGGRDAA